MIYMDNAATRLGNYGMFNINSPYATDNRVKFERARKDIANVLRCEPEHIYFTSGGCEANSWALQRSGCKNIITTKIEHPSVLNCCKWLEKHGCNVTYLNVNKNGLISLYDLQSTLLKQTLAPTLVSIMYVNNELGCVQDLKGIREIIDECNNYRQHASAETMTDFAEPIYLHSDCVQAVGQVKIPIQTLDMMSASGHKFGGNYGVGFLYTRIPMEPLIFGGSQENGLRGGTSNYNSVIKMADSLKLKLSDTMSNEQIKLSVEYLRQKLSHFDCIINTPENSLSNIVSVSFKGVDAEKLMVFLSGFQIYTSAGSACETDHKEASHVLRAIGVPEDYINGTLRFSLSEYIGVPQIDKTIDLIYQFIGEVE